MKRRIVDFGKNRRQLKRTKLEDGIFGSSLLHCKFLVIWLCVLGLDYLFEFRFEYLWPFWLLLRSLYDSFRYQGLGFSVLFLFMSLTIDALCLLYVPISWLFLLASTCVWIQVIWQTDKGFCMPTFFLWAVFVYIEGIVRVKDVNNASFHLDLCRPFAAHCIGYPVVTLSFGFKSYVGFQWRQKKQREIAQANKAFLDILDEALPKRQKYIADTSTKGVSVQNGTNNTPSNSKQKPSKVTLDSKSSNMAKLNSLSWSSNHKNSRLSNGSLQAEFEFMQQKMWSNSKSVNDFDGTETQKDKISCTANTSKAELQPTKIVNTQQEKELVNNTSQSSQTNNLREVVSSQKDRKIKYKENSKDLSTPPKDDSVSIIRLQSDIKRLKADLQASRQTEQELRNHINTLVSNGTSAQDELNQLQTDNDNLQNKLHNLVTARQTDRSTISNLEKKIQEEKKSRKVAENQIVQLEKRIKKMEEKNIERERTILSMKSECSESCRSRRMELEGELRRSRRDQRAHETHMRGLERENTALKACKENQSDSDVLMAALAAMQDKTSHLEKSLSAETKIKLELFSALGEAKRQIEISQGIVVDKEKQIEELKLKITEVLAVCPPSTFSQNWVDTNRLPQRILSSMDSSLLPCLGQCTEELGHSFSMQPESPGPNMCSEDVSNRSNLDPNARIYTPKGCLD